MAPTGKGTPKVKSDNFPDDCVSGSEASPSSSAAGAGEQGRKRKRRRGKLRPGRDLDHEYPGRFGDCERRFPPSQSEWPMFFPLVASCSGETEFTQFVGEAIATVRARHNARRRRIPSPVSL